MKRQEQKFFLSFEEISKVLCTYNAHMVHPSRIVNSIYFDTTDFKFYHEGEEGSVPREKYRFRWYGSPINISKKGQVEVKKTFDNFKTKESYEKEFKNFSEIQLAIINYCDNHIIPICQVSYERLYFANLNGLRFTYDYNIQFKNLNDTSFIRSPNNIFEIKYEDINSSYFSSLLGDKMTRFSKYHEAVSNLFEIS